MANDPYDVLGVKRDAAQKDIQSAYRKLAKKLHPDLNPGDKEAERRFKDLSVAYGIVGDPEKRARFDKGEIDATGTERETRHYYRDYAGAGAGAGAGRGAGAGAGGPGGPGANPYHSASGFADFGDAEDIFADLFSSNRRRGAGGPGSGAGFGAGERGFRMRGPDQHYTMEVDFLDALNGTKTEIVLPGGAKLDLKIPAGTRDGQTLRLRGKGGEGIGGAEPGDALIEIRVRAHPLFKRDGDDIRYEVPISLTEAVLGGRIRVPTPAGPVSIAIPENVSSGKVLRLKGKGAPKKGGAGAHHGDAYVTLRIVLPDRPDADLKAFVEGWEAGKAQNPRGQMDA